MALLSTPRIQVTELFDQLRDGLLSIDPVFFAEKYLTLDGKPFRLNGNGYKPFADIYRYLGVKALERDSKPVVLVKGRQVGATTMAAALELFFMTSGTFGVGGRPPMRIIHAFPLLELSTKYTKTKLNNIIKTAVADERASVKKRISFVESKIDKAAASNDSLIYKQFEFGNHIMIESVGLNGDRIRSLTADAVFFDECFPFSQFIETKNGKEKIGNIYRKWAKHEYLPLIKTFNEHTLKFEYKKVINAWKREKKELIKLNCGHRRIKCTYNHRFLTNRGWISAENLVIGDLLKISVGTDLHIRALNEDQEQIVLGSFLGDGHIANHKDKRNRLKVIHGIGQEGYCIWKASMFQAPVEYIINNGYSKKPAVRFCTRSFAMENSFPKTKTTCPQWVLDKLDERGFAIWFMDDGSVNQKCNACLSTCSFDEESQIRIVEKLKDMGIDCHYSFYKSANKVNGYFSIYINRSGYDRICEIINKYIHPNIQYKLQHIDFDTASYKWNNKYCTYGYTVVDSISVVNKKENVYDIEVEDNHNFIVTTGRRSQSLGGPIAHNCQDTPGIALANSIKVLSKSQWGRIGKGVQAYFGTPKGRGSDYWKIWQASSQQYYHLGCEACGNHFPLYTPGSSKWEEIWIEDNLPETHDSHGFIVKCVHCGHEQDKRPAAERGKWVTTKPAPDECEFIGYHINQLYMPTFRRADIIEEKPENNAINTERAYQNEVLGEFFAGDASPLTPDELREKCSDLKRRFRGQISMDEGKKVYLGCDWGLKVDIDQLAVGDRDRRQQGQSYSSVVVLSAEGPLLQIEFAKLLKANDLEHKRGVVEEMMRRYSVSLAVGDIGFAGDLTELLQKDYGDRFLMSRAVGQIKHHTKYIVDEFPKGIHFERNFYIAELFDMLKNGKIRFPFGDYEQVGWLIQHCCSMEIKPTVDRAGNATFNYVKGSTPNDGFMALLNAYLAYKFDITNGFNITNPNYMKDDPNKRQPISAITGYLPGLNPLKRGGDNKR